MAVGTRKKKRTPSAIAHDSMGVIHDCLRLVDDVDEALELLGSMRSVMDGIEVEVLGRSYASGASKRQVEVKLKHSSNMSTSEASKRATRGERAPQITGLAPAMINGEVNGEQADVLVDAASKTCPDAVNADGKFRRRVIATPVDQARKHKNEWVNDKLDDDELSARYARQRTLRNAKFWTTADGMTAMYAELDPILGERMRRRVEARADAMYQADGGRDVPASEHTRTRTQRMADALADVILGDSGDEIAQNRGGSDDRRPSSSSPPALIISWGRRRAQPNSPAPGRSLSRCSNTWPAAATWSASSLTAQAKTCGKGANTGMQLTPNGWRSWLETRAASNAELITTAAKPTISSRGPHPPRAKQTSRTSLCCASHATTPCTPTSSRSFVRRTALG